MMLRAIGTSPIRSTWNGILAAVGLQILLVGGGAALAANPTPVHQFYVPLPESQLLLGLQTIEAGGAAVNPMQTYISIAAIANGTIVYYDQWENGYDPDIANPANLYNGGNPGGTQVWGNGNPADGAPPGIPGDIINAGNVIVLNNPVNTTLPLNIDFDGRDKLAATKTVAVTRVGWATGSDTLLAGAVEVFDTDNWGTTYRAPVGENLLDATDFQMFEYTGLAIMAGEAGATIQVDADANGVFETLQVLNEGEGFFVNGGVNVGARVTSDNPVQVDLLTGDRGSTYESRDSALLPTTLWTNSYYTPVSTDASAGTTVWLYNPGGTNLTVDFTTRDGGGALITTALVVPGGTHGGVLKQIIPDGYGAHFEADTSFYAFSTNDSTSPNTGNNQAWDWGFTLVPEDSLTPQVLIGLGIGRDPTSGVSLGQNGNPVWVTPVGNGDTAVTVYVDFDANPATGPLTDPNGSKYNVTLSLRELDRAKIYDTTDNNQTGMLVYTLSPGVKLAAAWGQDPDTASAGAPGLDVGTGIPPLPLFAAGKNGTLDTDNDLDGFISPGDVLLYTISIVNISRAPVPDLLVRDTLPPGTTYIPNTTTFTNASSVTNPVPDDGIGTPFPLDGLGKILDPITALPVGGSYTVTFKVMIDSFANLPPGTVDLLNICSATAVGTTVPCQDRTPLNGCIGDFVWHDVDGDTVQDGGPELGIASVTLELYLDVNGDGLLDGGDTFLGTKITDAGGLYKFTGLLANKYIVNVIDGTVPPGYVLTTANDPKAITLAGGECNLTADFGYRFPCVPADCDDDNPCTADTCTPGGCVNTPVADTTSCPDVDGNACTQAACVQGMCNQSNTQTVCQPDGNECTLDPDCNPANGLCEKPPVPGTPACADTDNNACTQAACVAGTCNQSNTQTVCQPDGNDCTQNPVCNPDTGVCDETPVPDATPCTDTDSNLCTTPACRAGACVQADEETTCTISDENECTGTPACNPANGLCEEPPVPDGTPCEDTDDDVCTLAGCEMGTCEQAHENNDAECPLPPDHFSCYEIKPFSFTDIPGLSVVDRFGSTTVTAQRPHKLCAPANKNGEDPTAPNHPDHVTAYRMRSRPIKVVNQVFENQFGSITLDVVKAEMLLVPTAKSLAAPAPQEPADPAVDHFQCYKAKRSKGSAKFQKILDVQVEDQFGTGIIDLIKPTHLCAPANKRNEEPGAELHPFHLLCYKVKARAPFNQKRVWLGNQLGPLNDLLLVRRQEFCVPSTLTPQ